MHPPLLFLLTLMQIKAMSGYSHRSQVCIVGAGPAGATTSLFLSKQKIPHIIIDKAEFPRDKVCGDALSGKVISVLRKLDENLVSEIAASGEQFIGSWGVEFIAPNGKSLAIPFSSSPDQLEHAPGFIAKRIDFDHFMVKQIDDNYATKLFGISIQKISRVNGGVELLCEKEGEQFSLFTDLIIGADGERSVVLKEFNSLKKDHDNYCAGLRAYYEGVEGIHEQQFIELHFIKKALPGYFWIFPLPNGCANVGIGMPSSAISEKKANLKVLLQDIVENDPGIAPRFKNAKQTDKVRGWGLPLGSVKKRISGDNYLLTGDAASLIDPFTGEGIGNAMISGMIAARHIERALETGKFDAASLALYDREVYQKLWKELKLSRALQKLVKYPWLFNAVVNKANSNAALKETFIGMFEDLDIRSRLKEPSFYFKLLFR